MYERAIGESECESIMLHSDSHAHTLTLTLPCARILPRRGQRRISLSSPQCLTHTRSRGPPVNPWFWLLAGIVYVCACVYVCVCACVYVCVCVSQGVCALRRLRRFVCTYQLVSVDTHLFKCAIYCFVASLLTHSFFAPTHSQTHTRAIYLCSPVWIRCSGGGRVLVYNLAVDTIKPVEILQVSWHTHAHTHRHTL